MRWWRSIGRGWGRGDGRWARWSGCARGEKEGESTARVRTSELDAEKKHKQKELCANDEESATNGGERFEKIKARIRQRCDRTDGRPGGRCERRVFLGGGTAVRGRGQGGEGTRGGVQIAAEFPTVGESAHQLSPSRPRGYHWPLLAAFARPGDTTGIAKGHGAPSALSYSGPRPLQSSPFLRLPLRPPPPSHRLRDRPCHRQIPIVGPSAPLPSSPSVAQWPCPRRPPLAAITPRAHRMHRAWVPMGPRSSLPPARVPAPCESYLVVPLLLLAAPPRWRPPENSSRPGPAPATAL